MDKAVDGSQVIRFRSKKILNWCILQKMERMAKPCLLQEMEQMAKPCFLEGSSACFLPCRSGCKNMLKAAAGTVFAVHSGCRGYKSMWYVIQVMTGREEEMMRLCKTQVSKAVLSDCFCPKYEISFKKAGIRRIEKRILFPGYLFLDTEQVEAVHEALKKISGLTKVLKTGGDFTAITSAEQAFIMEHGNAEHVFAMSVGYMEGDRVRITEGAFAGYEGMLARVDRHNRYGVMEIDMFGRKMEMQFGLEIVSRV